MSEMQLAPWEKEIIKTIRRLRKGCKKCIVVIRFDGSAWQIFETQPPINSKHLDFERKGF
jgi:hypothetical protein